MKTEYMLSELAVRTGIKVFLGSFGHVYNCQSIFVCDGTLKRYCCSNNADSSGNPAFNDCLKYRFSKEYLEEMAPYTAYLLLNVTPKTVDYQNSQLLKIVAPDYKDALEKELSLNALWVKKNNVSTTFSATEATADTSDNTVSIRGVF